MSAVFEGLALLDSSVLTYVFYGVLLMTVVAIIPGLGGPFAIAVALPFALVLDPVPGIALLIAATVVSGTANTITSVLFGVPGSPSGVATILDGYPMAQRGEGPRAVAAGVGASVVGGIIGAVVLGLSLPVLRPIVLALSNPEFLMLILGALIFMAFLGQTDMMKSLIAGGLGLMLSFVGLERATGTPRFTFGELYLWDGIRLVPFMIGLFAFAEMLELMQRGGTISSQRISATDIRRQTWQGLRDVFVHWRTTVQGSILGLWIGVAPGLGDSAGQFMAYGQAARTSKHPERFGKGAIEGVIAPDAATNSKEGGALIPTMAFGIPGTPSMAVLIAAFIAFGIQPGTEMLVDNVEIVWMIIWILVGANILAGVIALFLVQFVAKMTMVRVTLIIGPVMLIGLAATYATTNHIGDVLTAVVIGFLGYGLVQFGYSRITFLIGYILGALMERHFLLSLSIYDWAFLRRPFVLLLLGGIVVLIVLPLVRARRRTSNDDDASSERAAADRPASDE